MLSLLAPLLLPANFATAYWIYETLNVTQWQWQSSVAVDDWLYIDGGELYADQNGKNTFFYLGQTISVSLSQSWTNATVQKYSIDTQRPVTDGHWSKQPSLFYDPQDNKVIQWGGWPYNNGDQSYVFTFTPNNQGLVDWYKIDTPITNSIDKSSPAIFGSAFAASNASFYSLGGIIADPSGSPYTAAQGFVEYDFTSNGWTNTSSLSATSTGFFVGGEAAFTSAFGQAGYLIFLGGSDPSSQSFDIETAPLIDMSNISLYDIAAKSWYNQAATGDIPPPRQFFCSVGGTSVQDTFEIFILGGSTNTTFDLSHPEDDGYLNVYTLSIPAFRWFKSPDGRGQVRRADHSCQLIGNRQMLVIGGTQPSSELGIAAIDPWPSGLGIFDMSLFAWSDGYDPTAAVYTQPDVVQEYYSYSYQVPVWGSPALEPIFAWSPPSTPNTSPSSPTPASPTSASSTTAAKSNSTTTLLPSPKPNHVAAIAGGAIGGLCAILLASALFYIFFLRERLRKKKQLSKTQADRHDVDTEKEEAEKLRTHELESPDYKKLEFEAETLELPVPVGGRGAAGRLVELEQPVPELPAGGVHPGVHGGIPRKPVGRAELP